MFPLMPVDVQLMATPSLNRTLNGVLLPTSSNDNDTIAIVLYVYDAAGAYHRSTADERGDAVHAVVRLPELGNQTLSSFVTGECAHD
jgi:hypothetical protein